MCVRIEQRTSARDLNRQLPGLRLLRRDLPAGGEFAANHPALILRDGGDGPLVEVARWGLVGSFLDVIPARPVLALPFAGLASRPFYSRLLRGQRCLLPASAFIVAGAGGRGETRVAAAGRPLLLAGVFDRHPQAGTTCALLSTAAAAALGTLGCTMPLLLGPAASALWLKAGDEFPGEEFAAALAEQAPPPLMLSELLPPEPSPQLAFAFA